MTIYSGHEGKDRVCCSCRHNKRIPKKTNIECRCDIDGHYIGYLECFDCWCRHWAKDPWQEKGEPMSIILKGIDLPKGKNNYALWITSKGEVHHLVLDEIDYKDELIATAIQIPEGHGRLIDEKEIIKRLEEKEEEPLYQHDTDDWWVGIIDAETEVNNSPTILESEG